MNLYQANRRRASLAGAEFPHSHRAPLTNTRTGVSLPAICLITVSNLNLNQIPDQYFSMGAAALLAQVKNPFYGIITNPGTPMSQPTVAAGLLLRPFPQFDRVLALDPYLGRSNYRSLQASF